VLVSMNDAVEGSALRLAAAADKGDMAEAASHLSAIAGGCVACHQVFRGQPGVSPLLIPPAGK
jgi:cytochrome c556